MPNIWTKKIFVNCLTLWPSPNFDVACIREYNTIGNFNRTTMVCIEHNNVDGSFCLHPTSMSSLWDSLNGVGKLAG
jgi:hypothetical protein